MVALARKPERYTVSSFWVNSNVINLIIVNTRLIIVLCTNLLILYVYVSAIYLI